MVTEIKNSEKWNNFSIVGFILSFFWFLSFIGLGLCIYSLIQFETNPARGRGPSIAGIVIGSINSLMSIFMIFGMVVA